MNARPRWFVLCIALLIVTLLPGGAFAVTGPLDAATDSETDELQEEVEEGPPSGDDTDEPTEPDAGTGPPPPADVPAPPGPQDTEEETDRSDESEDPDTIVRESTSLEPSLMSTAIPVGSVVLAGFVLVAALLFVRGARPRRSERPGQHRDHHEDEVRPEGAPPLAGARGMHDPATLDFLLALGEALIDAGDAVSHVQGTLSRIASVQGIADVGVIAMPTALIISVVDGTRVETEVAPAGGASLRLDQIDEVFRIVTASERGELSATQGTAAIEHARRMAPAHTPGIQLAGYVALTVGVAMLLRGGVLDLTLAGALGLFVGAVQLRSDRVAPSHLAFLPVVAAFGVSVAVFLTGRFVPALQLFPGLVAPLVTFLSGALLTTAVFELSTGQIISGAGRLASGGLRLTWLALGILAGAQLVGVPASAIVEPGTGVVSAVWPWMGVAVFGMGVLVSQGARRVSLPRVLVVLYVAYAGQVVGGLFFGSTLSAFCGAVALTPIAVIAAKRPSGPSALVSFLPGFWLLVPGAFGLAGVTSILDEDRVQGLSTLATMGTSMIGIALGVLLGLTIGSEVVRVAERHRPRRRPDLNPAG